MRTALGGEGAVGARGGERGRAGVPCCQRRGDTRGGRAGGSCCTATLCHPPQRVIWKRLASVRNTGCTFPNLWWSHCPCTPRDRAVFLVRIAKWWTSSLPPPHSDLCNYVLLGHSKQTNYYEHTQCPEWPEWNHPADLCLVFWGCRAVLLRMDSKWQLQ